MRRIGILLGGDRSTVKDRMDEIYDLEKKLAKVGSGKMGWLSWSRNPVSVLIRFNENPVILNFCLRFPEYHFLFQSRVRVQILANSAFRVADKECIPFMFLESQTVFWSNPGSQEYPVPYLVLMSKLVTKAKHL